MKLIVQVVILCAIGVVFGMFVRQELSSKFELREYPGHVAPTNSSAYAVSKTMIITPIMSSVDGSVRNDLIVSQDPFWGCLPPVYYDNAPDGSEVNPLLIEEVRSMLVGMMRWSSGVEWRSFEAPAEDDLCFAEEGSPEEDTLFTCQASDAENEACWPINTITETGYWLQFGAYKDRSSFLSGSRRNGAPR